MGVLASVWVRVYNWERDLEVGYYICSPSRQRCVELSEQGGYDHFDARTMLALTMSNKAFATPGRRNDDAVNACIGLYAMGFSDVNDPGDRSTIIGFLNDYLKEEAHMQDVQVIAFLDHVERILPYLETWWRSGHFLDYAIK